jgi:flavin reductase (DIM6/NTAB) family NADH-FMN oxidoreductase RutF
MKLADPYNIRENVFSLLDKDWMLITAGQNGKFNTMTASWGGFGILWNQPVAFIFVRPVRFTYEFLNEFDTFTLSFFKEGYRKALNYCGAHSGRDVDKMARTGLVPVTTESGNVYFEGARLVFECRKLYYQDINPENFLDTSIEKNYPKKDYHRIFIGKIEKCLVAEEVA